MKPEKWEDMPRHTQEEYAVELFQSPRGAYIIGQALYIASEAMKKHPFPETSNIQDMEVLSYMPRFTMGYHVTAEVSKLRATREQSHEGHQGGAREE